MNTTPKPSLSDRVAAALAAGRSPYSAWDADDRAEHARLMFGPEVRLDSDGNLVVPVARAARRESEPR